MATFERAYSAEDIVRGVDMVVHPITGDRLSHFIFHEALQRFYHNAAKLWDPDPWYYYLPIIGPARDVVEGDAYPVEWKYNPYQPIPQESW